MRQLLILPLALGPVLAHAGEPLTPPDLGSAWNWSLPVLGGLLLAAGLYGLGVGQLWRRAGVGKGVKVGQAIAWAGGLLTLFVALVSPLEALAETLFSAHMVQHMLLVLLAAPLLALGHAGYAILWALPLEPRRTLGHLTQSRPFLALRRSLTHPLTVWLLATGVFWLWHVPAFYQAALEHEGLHALEHLSLLATSFLFWQATFRLDAGSGVLYLFAASVASSALGALITFSPQVWYPAYTHTTAWGLSGLEDQQLAGLVMWLPMGVAYTVLSGVLFVRWFQRSERGMGPEPAYLRGGE